MRKVMYTNASIAPLSLIYVIANEKRVVLTAIRRHNRSVYAVRAVYTLYTSPPSSFVRTTKTRG